MTPKEAVVFDAVPGALASTEPEPIPRGTGVGERLKPNPPLQLGEPILDVRAAAADLIAGGFAVCRINPATKRPSNKGWPTGSAMPDEFQPDEYLGILAGPLSSGEFPGRALVIIDLDQDEAVRCADAFLPTTGMTEGRPGKPKSHRYYLVPLESIPEWAYSSAPQAAEAAIARVGHPGPFKKGFDHRATNARVIDWLGTGGQVVCPPSPHPSGEQRAWIHGVRWAAQEVTFHELWDAVCQLASRCGAAIPVPGRPSVPSATASSTVRRRAISYLAKMAPAVNGQGGHKAAFAAARAMVYGFDLGAADGFRVLAEHYNPRCVPPWSEPELRHKCEDADRAEFGKARGWLANAKPKNPRLIRPAAARPAQNGGPPPVTAKPAEQGAMDLSALGEPAAPPPARPSRPPANPATPDFFANFMLVPSTAEGEEPVPIGLSASAVHQQLAKLSGNWPRRIGSALFVPDGDRGPRWLTKVATTFGWIQSLFPDAPVNAVQWRDRGVGMLPRSEFDAYLRQQVPAYQAVEAAPHEPALGDHFYIHPVLAGGDGRALTKFVAFFRPSDEDDDLLIRAFLMTLVWGGPYGHRPAFLVTGPDQDERMGRGVGKTTLVRMAARLVGGTFDVRPTDEWKDVMTRLLSDTACATQRVILIDNVKTHRFSWADVEALITAEHVNGRKLYVGDGNRPNTFVVAITLNGASLSKDLAQRCVIVKLERPAYAAGWVAAVERFVDENRWAILGDLVASLRAPVGDVGDVSRWGCWEREVLGRLANPQRLQALIEKRREAVDDDEEEASLIRQAIVEELTLRGHGDPDHCGVRIRPQDMAAIVSTALRERLPTNAASTKLKAMGGAIPELSHRSLHGCRVWVWQGRHHQGPLAWLRDRPAGAGNGPW